MTVLAVTNQKGGVGKTTTVVSLGAYLGAMGERVLLVDCDPQANTTSGVGVTAREGGLYGVLTDGTVVTEAIVPTTNPGVDLLPATAELAGAEIELLDEDDRTGVLVRALSVVRASYACAARLSAVARTHHAERPGRRGRRADPRAMRVSGARGPGSADGDAGTRARQLQSAAAHLRATDDHVRRTHLALAAGDRRGPAPLPEPDLLHGGAAERPAQRGAQLRRVDPAVRPPFARGRGVCQRGTRGGGTRVSAARAAS